MAYNPFNIFRRNQKAIFAVITVFIMFTFVLSSGLGGGADFFDWLPRWLAGKSKKGDVMCSIDGSKVYESELSQLRFNRVMANRFMNQGALHTRHGLDNYVEEQLPRLSPEVQMTMSQIVRSERQFAESPQLAALLPRMIPQMRIELNRLLRMPNIKPDDSDVIRVKLASLTLLQALMTSGGDGHFFGNAPNRTDRDRVNFILWQMKADQLGIKFTTDDIKKLIDHEFYGFFQAQSQVFVTQELQRNLGGFNINRCIEAIGEEFRVRMAQVAVLGPGAHGGRTDKTFGGFPAFSPPYELYEYYVDRCSPTTYAAIPVPAINFVSQVKDPDEKDPKVDAELRDLFKKYQNEEPNLARETPGLKDPRKVKVEWFSLTGTEPYYMKEAEAKLKNELLQAQLRAIIVAPGLGLSPGMIHHIRGFAEDPLVAREYEQKVQQHKFALYNRYNKANMDRDDLLDSSVYREGNLVAAAGGMGGQVLAFGNPFVAAVGMSSAQYAYEMRDRTKAGMQLFLGAVPGPGMFPTLAGGEVAYRELLPKPLPLAAVQPELMKNLNTITAKKIAFGDPRGQFDFPTPTTDTKKKGDLPAFIEEVTKLSENGRIRATDKDKQAALRKYIDEFVAKRGLKIAGNKTAASEWTLAEEPELATLVAAQKKSLSDTKNPHGGQYIPFANSFFWEQGNRRSPVTGTYKPEAYLEQRGSQLDSVDTSPHYYVWRTEEIQAQAYPSYDKAKPAVIAAWKHMKARELAKERAEKVANAIRAGGPVGEALLPFTVQDHANQLAGEFASDPTARDRILPFTIEGVCPLTPNSSPTKNKGVFAGQTPLSSAQLQPFNLVPTENVKYPSRDMATKLLAERTKEPKTVVVLPDEPKDIYFVVTLLKRDVKSEDVFKRQIYEDDPAARAAGLGMARGAVIESFAGDSQMKTVESVMGLLKKEFKFEETEEQKKKLDERRGSEQ